MSRKVVGNFFLFGVLNAGEAGCFPVAVVVADQLVKWWVVATLPGKPIVLVEGFLQLRVVSNLGAAFSLLDGFGSVIGLIGIAAAVFIFLLAVKVDSTGLGVLFQ